MGRRKKRKKKTHLRLLRRSPFVLFQAQSAPRPGLLPSTTRSSTAGYIHRCRRRRSLVGGPKRLTRPGARRRLCQHLGKEEKKSKKNHIIQTKMNKSFHADGSCVFALIPTAQMHSVMMIILNELWRRYYSSRHRKDCPMTYFGYFSHMIVL